MMKDLRKKGKKAKGPSIEVCDVSAKELQRQ